MEQTNKHITLTKIDCIKELVRIGIELNYGENLDSPISFTAEKILPDFKYGISKFFIDIFSISKKEWENAKLEFEKEKMKNKTKKEIKRDMLLSFIEAIGKISKETQRLRASHETLTITFKDGRNATGHATRALNDLRRTGVRR